MVDKVVIPEYLLVGNKKAAAVHCSMMESLSDIIYEYWFTYC